MFLRNVLLALGGVLVLVGAGLFIAWFSQMRSRPVAVVERSVESRPAVLVAARTIALGTLLRKEDIAWKDVMPGEVRPGYLMRGQVSEAEFLGAISRRNFAQDEPLIASEFVKPGDRVDVILTQSFGEQATDPGRKTVSETMLRDVRVIAIDQSLTPSTNVAAAISTEARIPKTVTLELLERQAEALMVAAQLGKFQLAVLPLERVAVEHPEEQTEAGPVWASDVSPALREVGPPALRKCNPDESLSGSSLECLVRRPPNSSGGSAPFFDPASHRAR